MTEACISVRSRYFCVSISDLRSESRSGVSLGKTPAAKRRLHGYLRNIRGFAATKAPLKWKLQSCFSTFPQKTNYAAAGSKRRRVTAVSDDSSRRSLDGVFLDYSSSEFGLGGSSIEDGGRSVVAGTIKGVQRDV